MLFSLRPEPQTELSGLCCCLSCCPGMDLNYMSMVPSRADIIALSS